MGQNRSNRNNICMTPTIFFMKKEMVVQEEINIQKSSINQKSDSTVSVILCTGADFEIGIFSFNSYVYYLTRGFITSTHAFNLLPLVFNLATFNLSTRAFSLLTRGFKLVTRELEQVTFGFELATRISELVTCNS